VFCSPDFINALRETNEVTKFLSQDDFKEGKDINFQIFNYQGRKLVETAPDRLRTNVILGAGGYYWSQDSKPINFLMADKTAVMHIVKYEKVKVIGDELNLAGQGFDGYTIFARIYHDVFVPDNKRVGLYCSVKGSGAPMGNTLDILADADYRIKSITTWPGERIALVFKAAELNEASEPVAVGDDASDLVNASFVRLGDAIDFGKDYYSVIDGKVAAIWKPISISATAPDASYKFNVYVSSIDPDVAYKYTAAASAPVSVTGTALTSGDELTQDATYPTWVIAYKDTTVLKTVEVADKKA